MKIRIIEPFDEYDLKIKVEKGTRDTVPNVCFQKGKEIGGIILTKDMDALCAAWQRIRKAKKSK